MRCDALSALEDRPEVAGQRIGHLAQDPLDLHGLIPEVERPRGGLTAVMERAHERQAAGDMVGVPVVERNAALAEARDLPARDGILVDERLVESQMLGDAERMGGYDVRSAYVSINVSTVICAFPSESNCRSFSII